MTPEQEKELLEHQKDCDYNRASHFKEYQKLMHKHSQISSSQLILGIALTTIYIIYFSVHDFYPNFFQILGLVITLVLTVLSIIAENKKYIENAHKNWLAAQSYQELYRDCQFFKQFPQNNTNNDLSYGIYRIRKQLNTLNLLSPHIESFLTKEEIENIENKYKNKDIQRINLKQLIKENIKFIFQDKLVNVYIFGNNKNNLEIDICIIMQNGINLFENELLKKINDFQFIILKEYNIYLDINLFKEVDFYSYKELPFNLNVCKGELILDFFKESNSKYVNIQKRIKNKIDTYKNIVKNELKKSNNNKEIIVFGLYYSYYHLIIFILIKNKIIWNSEKEMIQKFINLIKKDNNLKEDDIKNYILVIQLKNIILHNYFEYTNYELLKTSFIKFENFYRKIYK